MAIATLFYLPNSLFSHKPIKAISFSTPKCQIHEPFQTQVQTRTENPNCVTIHNPKAVVALFGAGLTLSLIGPASAAELPLLGSTLELVEPANALSLPTWAIHVSSVVEWITAMALVWQYGEQSGYESWKGLAWGMVSYCSQPCKIDHIDVYYKWQAFIVVVLTSLSMMKLTMWYRCLVEHFAHAHGISFITPNLLRYW